MQIRSLESNAVVGILGVESESRQRRWEDFSTIFTNFVKKNWDADAQFSDAIWSDGCWLHLTDMGSVTLRAETTDDTGGGLIRDGYLTILDWEGNLIFYRLHPKNNTIEKGECFHGTV